jgi:hypothetical protein
VLAFTLMIWSCSLNRWNETFRHRRHAYRFGDASGLYANLEKSVATPIHCSDEQIALVRHMLDCRVQDFPCRYLGIPLSIFKLRR